MKKIVFDNPHRRAHFEFFNQMNHPHFNICANIDITNLVSFVKKNQLHFTPTIVYLIAKTANDIKEFRWRIRGQEVIEHESVQPSFTVHTQASEVFSFCTVDYDSDYTTFTQRAEAVMEEMQTNPSVKDEPGRDDFLFLSSIPWVSFTSFQHAMSFHPQDSVPRITWGKYFEEQGKIKMPLSVQVHHAVVDGRHVGQFFQDMERLARELDTFK